MGTAKHIGRVGALAVALGVGNVRRTATRMTVSIGAAALVVMATVVSAPVSPVSPDRRLSADSTALIMGGTGVPTPDDYYIDAVKNQYIAPTHPGQDIDYVAVTTPEELWPLTGIVRLLGLALGAPELFGPGGLSVAGRAVVETLGALRPHRRSVDPGRGRRSGGGDGRARQRQSGDLRLLTRRGRREPGEAKARRAIPGGNQGPRHRLRAAR